MALEDLLTKLIASLDVNTAAVNKAGGGAPAGKTAAPAAAATKTGAGGKTPQFDELKAAAAKVMDKHGKPFAKKMIKDVGGGSELATVKTEKYGSLMAAFEKSLAEAGAVAEEEEDEL